MHSGNAFDNEKNMLSKNLKFDHEITLNKSKHSHWNRIKCLG